MNYDISTVPDEEFHLIEKMVENAEENGLLVEVIHSFYENICRGQSLVDAVHEALHEWDI